MSTPRSGILAAGNFIVDQVKRIDRWPEQDTLATILSSTLSNGGGPYNVLKDLAALDVAYPLEACGLVGDDDFGRWITTDCTHHGIRTDQLHRSREHATSYTDAMTVQGSGRRTFFHHPGANAAFDVIHCNLSLTKARLLHLGYLLLLERLDAFDEQGITRAAHLLALAQSAGLQTSVDLVSSPHPQYRKVVLSAMPFTDHLLLNEWEAAQMLGREVRAENAEDHTRACAAMLELGVRRSVTLHSVHGAVTVSREEGVAVQGSLLLPTGFNQGATGAGDAFASGMLHGLHEGWPVAERLRLAVCVAAASLSHPTPSGGVMPASRCLTLSEHFTSNPRYQLHT